jgi:DNA-binding GntR family transcriptional regulator
MIEQTHLRLQTASRAVADRLRDEIGLGVLAPGTKLRQSELARRFGVSTTPVREALASLEAEALVRIDAHRGAVVSAPTLDDMSQCFAIRRALEPLAAAEAAPRLVEAELAALQDLIDTMRATDELSEWVELNDRFHMRLYAASCNERLQEIIESLRKSSRYYIRLFVENGLQTQAADDDHQAILDACRSRNPVRVRSLTQRHVDQTRRGVTEFLRKSQPREQAPVAY